MPCEELLSDPHFSEAIITRRRETPAVARWTRRFDSLEILGREPWLLSGLNLRLGVRSFLAPSRAAATSAYSDQCPTATSVRRDLCREGPRPEASVQKASVKRASTLRQPASLFAANWQWDHRSLRWSFSLITPSVTSRRRSPRPHTWPRCVAVARRPQARPSFAPSRFDITKAHGGRARPPNAQQMCRSDGALVEQPECAN